MLDETTIYNYMDTGLLFLGDIDFKVRRKKTSVWVDKQCYLGRT